MAQDIFVSIIVPVYGVEQWLPQCINSILSQPHDDFELILVDDGSPDRCPQICDEYAAKDERVLVIHKTNGGVAAARNAGLDIACGEWIWFVDGDDYIMPNSLTMIEERMKACGDCDFVQMGMLYDENGKITKTIEAEECLDADKNTVLKRYPCYHNPRILFKNTGIVNHNHRFTAGIRLAEDQEFQLKYMMTCQRPMQINVKPYVYRQREGSAVHQSSTERRKVDDTFKVLHNLCAFILDNAIKPEPWLEFRIAAMMRSLLYAASLTEGIDRRSTKHRLREVMKKYAASGFKCVNSPKLRLARINLTAYFIINHIYLHIKGA